MHRETKIKIIGTGIFIISLLLIISLVYHTNQLKEDRMIESIQVSGNNLLSKNDYLSFVKLTEQREYKNLTLPVIKSRFEKHPYVFQADVKFTSEKTVNVFLTEKRIYGVIIKSGEPLLAAENFQVLPVLPDTRMINIPVLSNIEGVNDFHPLDKLNNRDILQAYRIIDAVGLTNPQLQKDLAEINLRKGGDVIIAFSGLNFPIVFGRGSEAKKMVSLEAILNHRLADNSESEYIDLRFFNDVYIGYTKRVEL